MTGAPTSGGPMIAAPAPVVAGSLGILGGTFDPIHLGHLAIGEEVRERLGLERVLFVPAGVPPHRLDPPGASAEDRLAMVRLAIADNAAFAVSRIELDRDGPSFSVDTVAAIAGERRASRARGELWFIASDEAFRALPTWHEADRLLSLARFAVVPRASADRLDRGWVARTLPGMEDRVAFLEGPLLPISGTAIRARVAAGRSLRYLVPDAVARYIREHRLYHDSP